MKAFGFSFSRTSGVLAATILAASFAFSAVPQNKAAQVSDGERKALQKINDAKDAAAKLQAAKELVEKYPKSSLRPKIVEQLLGAIGDVKDPAQKIPLAEGFLGTFAEANESNKMYPIVIDAYIAAKRLDDAFNAAKPWLELNPNEVDVLYMLAVVGTDEARRQNAKYAGVSQQYGLKAIELIEADKRPEAIPAENWSKAKTTWLAQLYQSVGLLALMKGSNAEAMAKLQKAATLNQNDPFNYVLLGNIKNEDYTREAKLFQSIPAGQAKTEAEKKLMGELDEIIDLFAHAIGLMEGKPQYKPLSDQMLPDLTSYYTFRHKSTTGMQELIQKYKQPATP
ncbi:MAG: hypothetical protein QOJ64_3303 [Acidobacteriota bacterium]|nr:hypothetical protein [Acidobacteriota bacterium]